MRIASPAFWIVMLPMVVAAALAVLARTQLIPNRYNPLAPLDLAERPNPVTQAKLWMMAGDTASCLDALRRAGVTVSAMPARREGPNCRRLGTVTISKFSHAEITPEEMKCDIALRLYLLERHDIQPLAQQYFGASVKRLYHFGSYSCRTIHGSGWMSEHATANAFDLAGFGLSDGHSIFLKNDWRGGAVPRAFLHDIRTRACLFFNMVLSPDYNVDHVDHFHLDMGLLMGCH